MYFYPNIEYENQESKDVFDEIVEKASNYDIYNFIARVSGLNLLPQNQNKAVLLDTLLQYILSKPRNNYKSSIKMSDKKFKSLIERLNNTSLTTSIDPCENTFIQNVMFNSENHRVFNGIDITPAYNLQALIRCLFGYKNHFCQEYLHKVNILFAFLLGISEDIASDLDIKIDNVEYDESHKVIIPSGKTVRQHSQLISIPISRVKNFIDGYFSLDELCIDFGEEDIGDINNRPFYSKPFIINSEENELLVLNISLLPSYALYKAFEWADYFGIKEDVIRAYNNYLWLETRKTLDLMGHKKINEQAYGIECISNDYYKDSILSVYNNQVMFVFYICDDGKEYSEKTMHSWYPDSRHSLMLQRRLEYFKDNIQKLGVQAEDIFIIIIKSSIGRELMLEIKNNSFGYKPIALDPFELHCISIHERENIPFLPRYIRSKSKLHTMKLDLFSELNAICIYTSNHNSFYMNDDFDPDEINLYIAPGDSLEYITESLIKENRILIDSYDDGNKMEVILADKERNIYVEDQLFPEKYMAMCILYKNVKIWILTDKITDYKQINIFHSLLDALSYWLAECKSIIELYIFPYDIYTVHLFISGEVIEFYQDRPIAIPFDHCIDQYIEKNHIYLVFRPEAYRNLNQIDNSQEKELCEYVLDIFDDISYENRDYSRELDKIFANPLKKKFLSVESEREPYLKSLQIENYRTIHEEDEDFLSEIIGKELLRTGEWKIGVVENSKRSLIAKLVVNILYNRLESMIVEFEPNNMLEVIYQDLEETLFHLILAERRFYSDVACYPEKEDLFIKAYNDLNRTSLSLKFLIEYVTACPPSGAKHFGLGQYEELLAICAMIIDWAYKSDLFFYNMINTPVEFLKSKRIGMKHDEFADMNHYNDTYRRRQLKYDSSYSLRRDYKVSTENFKNELEDAFIAEFGYSYSDFIQVVTSMISINEEEIICISKSDLHNKISMINGNPPEIVINKVLIDITYCPRNEFLKSPQGFDKEDAYPWRFNRKYSFNRRPVLERNNCLIWGNRQLYHMVEYLTDLIYSGKFKATSNEMKLLCGKIAKSKGAAFNDLIVQMIQDMNAFIIFSNVKKINGKKIAENGKDLGDIDVLIIDQKTNKIIVTEVKNFRFSRNPREIYQEYEKMFVDKADKPCFATKHSKRTKWVEEHIEDVIKQYGLDDKSWTVTSLFIVNQSLISQYIYKQKIRCISKAELSIETIRSV